jgi:hypothetical protein
MDFWQRMQKAINKGVESSKEVLEKATDKAKDLGEVGVLKFEIKQLENQGSKALARLGNAVHQVLVKEGHATVSKKSTGVKEILQEIDNIEERIQEKEEALKKFE